MTSAKPPRVHVDESLPERVNEILVDKFILIDDVAGADGVLSTVTTRVDSTYLDRAGPRLKIVANYGVGVDNIDLDAARARSVIVTNTPDVLTRATAEFAIGLMLSLLRRVAEGDRYLRTNPRWEFSLEFMVGEGLEGKTVAIVGPGRIGRETARLVEAFGASPIFVGRGESLQPLADADIVSIHCPLTSGTLHLIDGRALTMMRPTAVLVNTARGPVVNEGALIEALRKRTIAGAALDVFEFEPSVAKELLTLENLVLTPHLGSATRAAREAMGLLAAAALKAVLLEGKTPWNAV
jgi:glyoxylate reductase